MILMYFYTEEIEAESDERICPGFQSYKEIGSSYMIVHNQYQLLSSSYGRWIYLNNHPLNFPLIISLTFIIQLILLPLSMLLAQTIWEWS